MEWFAAMEIATRYWGKSPISQPPDDIINRLKEKLSETSPDACDSGYDDDETAVSIDDMWTIEEDLTLKKWAVVFNLNWRRIANLMPGRTSATCQKRWDGFRFPERFLQRESESNPVYEAKEKLKSEIRELCANNQDQCLNIPPACFQALQPSDSEFLYRLSYDDLLKTKIVGKKEDAQSFLVAKKVDER